MRIGLVIDEYNPVGGGAERWTAQFHAHLQRAGHEVHVLTFRAVPPHDVRHLHLAPDPGTPTGRAAAMDRLVASLPPMVLHDGGTGCRADVFHPHTGSRLLSLRRLLAAQPPLRRLRAALSPRMALLRHRLDVVERHAARDAGHVVALSRALATLLAERHGVPPARLTVIPNGVDTARFAHARLQPLRAAARAALGAGDTLILLMVAHNLRLKGADTAMRALARLRAAGLDAALVIAGGAPDRRWQTLATNTGISGHVRFCGDVADIEQFYAAADIFLHPTRWDACSLATIEALAAGLPVITTAANGAADLITHGVEGLVLPDPEDAAALARAVQSLADPAPRQAMALAAARTGARADLATNCAAVETLLLRAAATR